MPANTDDAILTAVFRFMMARSILANQTQDHAERFRRKSLVVNPMIIFQVIALFIHRVANTGRTGP